MEGKEKCRSKIALLHLGFFHKERFQFGEIFKIDHFENFSIFLSIKVC